MTRLLLAILMMSAIVFAGCGGGGDGSDENVAGQDTAVADAYKQMREKRGELTSTEEKLAMTKEFLKKHPVGEHTAGALYAVFYYQGYELDDKAGAVTYAESIRAGMDDPGIALAVDKRLVAFYSEAGMTGKMVALADQLAADGNLDFDGHCTVVEGAIKVEDWAMARDYSAKARGMVHAEAIRAEKPDHEYTNEDIAEEVNHRTGYLLVKDGWARANLGETGDALVDFADADEIVPRYYFDIPEYDLNVYWGNTLLMVGEFEEAVDRFARSGLIMRNEEALAGLKKAYAGIHGSDAGYEEFADKLHVSIATTFDDFEMPDYEGNRHRFSDLRGEVTLLSLWFPT